MANIKISALTSATTPLAGTETLPIVQSSTTTKVSVANLTAGRAVTGLSFSATTWLAGQAPRQNPNTSGTTVDFAVRVADNVSSIALDMGQSNVPAINTAWMQVRNQSSFALNYNLAIQPNGGQVTIGTMTSPTATTQLGVAVGNIQMMTAAKGINFTANTPAAGMTSQLLNWYEEGTWTPVLRFGGGTTGITYTTQQGRYTRIGRTVTIRFEITLSSKGSSTGEADITGLPFSAANLNAMSVYLYSNFLLTYKVGIAYCNGSTINEIAANGTAAFTDVQFTNTSRFWATCTYQV